MSALSFTYERSAMTPAAWWAAATLSLCAIGLMHDPSYLTARGEISVESGEGIEQEEKFQKDVGAAPWRRMLGFAGMLAVGALCCFGQPQGVRSYWGPTTLLLGASLGWAFMSREWSADPHETSRELVRLAAYTFVGAALARRFAPLEICTIIVVILCASAATAAISEVATGNFKPWRLDYRLQGTVHSNVLARQALLIAVAALAFLSDARSSRNWRLVLVAALVILFLTKSRTGAGTFLAGAGALRLISSSWRTITLLACLAVTTVGAALMTATFGGSWIERQATSAMTLGRNEDVTSLTGRLPLWKSIWNESKERKVKGFGYGAFWLPAKTQDIGTELKWYPRHAHSAYVEILVNLGIVGLALVVLTAMAAALRAAHVARLTNLLEYRLLAAFFVCGLVNGVAEAAFVLPRDLGLFVSMAAFSLVFMHPQLRYLLAGTLLAEADDPFGKETGLHWPPRWLQPAPSSPPEQCRESDAPPKWPPPWLDPNTLRPRPGTA